METRPDQIGSVPASIAKNRAAKIDSIKKWLGLGAALLSVVSAAYGTLEYWAEKREHARATAQLLATSHTQVAAQDYAQAWATLQQAAKGAGSEGLLLKWLGGTGTDEAISAAQQDVAMDWVRAAEAKVEEGHTYGEITDQVLPVLSGAVQQANGVRKADLLAHIGWVYTLKREGDGATGMHPEQFYRDSLALDANNPYANTFMAAPIVGQTDASEAGIAQVRQHFQAALDSGRATGPLRLWIRDQELGSVRRWLSYPAADRFFWQTVDEMHRAGEPLGEALGDMRGEYVGTEISVSAFSDNLDRVQAFVPFAEHVELLRALLSQLEPDARRYVRVSLALALQRSGKLQESLAAWRDAKTGLGGDDIGLSRQIDAAVARLALPPAKRG
jgi:hypothetical protein